MHVCIYLVGLVTLGAQPGTATPTSDRLPAERQSLSTSSPDVARSPTKPREPGRLERRAGRRQRAEQMPSPAATNSASDESPPDRPMNGREWLTDVANLCEIIGFLGAVAFAMWRVMARRAAGTGAGRQQPPTPDQQPESGEGGGICSGPNPAQIAERHEGHYLRRFPRGHMGLSGKHKTPEGQQMKRSSPTKSYRPRKPDDVKNGHPLT